MFSILGCKIIEKNRNNDTYREKILYFCIVKHLNSNFKRLLCSVFVLLFSFSMTADAQGDDIKWDSVEVSLLTCFPHEEVYSLYGHSAIRWHDLSTGEDWTFNWGIFNFKQSGFILRFVFGKTDYELGVYPFDIFCKEYKQFGSQIREQVLNLTADDKKKLYAELANNAEPENRVYRYNFFYDNCSTRPRNMVEQCLNGKIQYEERQSYTPSYREMIHEMNSHHPWAAFGNDLLLGLRADFPTDMRQQEFMPLHLMHDFEHAQVYENGTYRPLVVKSRNALNPGVQIVESEFPLSPMQCAIVLFVISAIVAIVEWRKKQTYRWFDLTLLIPANIVGIVLVLMIFSEHPTTSINLQLLLLNPLSLFFLPAIVKHRKTMYWIISLVLIILFFIGAFFQDYAEGMEIVALCLLTRSISHLINEK